MYRNGVPSHDEAARDPENPNEEAGSASDEGGRELILRGEGYKIQGTRKRLTFDDARCRRYKERSSCSLRVLPLSRRSSDTAGFYARSWKY